VLYEFGDKTIQIALTIAPKIAEFSVNLTGRHINEDININGQHQN